MLEAPDLLTEILCDKTFAALDSNERARMLARLEEIKSRIEDRRGGLCWDDRALHLAKHKALTSGIAAALAILEDEGVGAFDALDRLTDQHEGGVSTAMRELRAFRATCHRLLDGAKDFEPQLESRCGRPGELQLRVELKKLAFYELIELVESVGIFVSRTSRKGGPGSRLLVKLMAYATGLPVSIAKVKALIGRRQVVE
jgi:hypothetical protein